MLTADEHLKFVSLRNRKTKSTNDMTENLRAASGPPADPSTDRSFNAGQTLHKIKLTKAKQK